jgi:hypothetical protein
MTTDPYTRIAYDYVSKMVARDIAAGHEQRKRTRKMTDWKNAYKDMTKYDEFPFETYEWAAREGRRLRYAAGTTQPGSSLFSHMILRPTSRLGTFGASALLLSCGYKSSLKG